MRRRAEEAEERFGQRTLKRKRSIAGIDVGIDPCTAAGAASIETSLLSGIITIYRMYVRLFPLNSEKLSPVCSSLQQFVPVRPNDNQSQKTPRIHGVKFESRISGRDRAPSWVTVGHDG